MNKEEISQGYPVVNGFPKYVTISNSRLEYCELNKQYYCPDGDWYLQPVCNKDRHLVVSHHNNWQLSSSKGKYLQPITLEQYKELGKCPSLKV
jgi:hypothetical protein